MPQSGDPKRPRVPTPEGLARCRWQPLAEHSRRVADLCARSAAEFGAEAWGYRIGLAHDLGKYGPRFQDRLHRCWEDTLVGRTRPGERVDHKLLGTWVCSHWPDANLLAIVSDAHHGGLPKRTEAENRTSLVDQQPEVRRELERALQDARRDLPELDRLPALPQPEHLTDGLEVELFLRMLFSCLVDADAADTEAHFDPEQAAQRGTAPPLERYWELLEAGQSELLTQVRALGAGSTVNRVRREVYEGCLAAAELPPGVFRLTVPTGGGKTRSSLAFALKHALRHGHRRVIYAIPYTSIIEQTAGVFRGILTREGEALPVLEHHSAVPDPDEDAPEGEGPALWRRLACQDWDAPLIVTTTVQLFESLFGNRPGRGRKVHRLARAVIILDEVQTLPLELLQPLVGALNSLARGYGATIVLCTATQPALEGDNLWLKGFSDVREIVPQDQRERHFSDLRRVRYHFDPEPWSWERAAREALAHPQCLTILNTRKDAMALVEALKSALRNAPPGAQPPKVVHLSTLLCPAHRRRKLAEVKAALLAGEPLQLVSTQVVEAGVDIDFPAVLRALGPLERIIQAAGRCNREGRLEEGLVTIFCPEEGSVPPGAYRTALAVAEPFLGEGQRDLSDPAVVDAYYRSLLSALGKEGTDKFHVQALRTKLDFPAVAGKVKLIRDDTVSVLVRYEPELQRFDEVRAEVERTGHLSRKQWRQAQPVLVSMRRREADALLNSAMEWLTEDLYVWRGRYDDVLGVTGEFWDPSDSVL